jgi:hypothetical protein
MGVNIRAGIVAAFACHGILAVTSPFLHYVRQSSFIETTAAMV